MSGKVPTKTDKPEPIGKIPFLVTREVEDTEVVVEQTGDAQEEALFGLGRKKVEKVVEEFDGDKLKESIDKITNQLEKVLENQSKPSGGFVLESFKVGLKVEGKAKIALVAELGGEASIELTFKRC